MKKLALLLGLLLASPAFAVDNTVIVTPGTGVTMRSKDVGSGVESMIHIIGDATGNPIYGTAGTANANILTVQGIASMTPFLTTTTLNAETTKVIGTTRNVGNVGGVFDAIGQNVAAPANWLQIGCQFQTTPTTITATNGSPFQCDSAANALVNVKVSALPSGASTSANQTTELASLASIVTNTGATASTLTGWTSGTALNATQIINATGGAPAILVQLNQTSTLSAGAITFEGTYDGTNWVSLPVAQVLNPNTFANLTNPYTLVASTNQPFLLLTQGYQSVRIKLSTQITGTATVTPFVTLLPYNPTIGALLNPLAAGSAIIGKAGIDQTTDGTTNGVRLTNGYPAGATPLTASATGTTAATTATLAGAASKTTYICSLSVRANATANANVTDTVTGVISGTLSRALWVPANTAGLGVDEQIYNPCVPASGTNTAIAVVSGAPGTGGVVTVNATGYQQ